MGTEVVDAQLAGDFRTRSLYWLCRWAKFLFDSERGLLGRLSTQYPGVARTLSRTREETQPSSYETLPDSIRITVPLTPAIAEQLRNRMPPNLAKYSCNPPPAFSHYYTHNPGDFLAATRRQYLFSLRGKQIDRPDTFQFITASMIQWGATCHILDMNCRLSPGQIAELQKVFASSYSDEVYAPSVRGALRGHGFYTRPAERLREDTCATTINRFATMAILECLPRISIDRPLNYVHRVYSFVPGKAEQHILESPFGNLLVSRATTTHYAMCTPTLLSRRLLGGHIDLLRITASGPPQQHPPTDDDVEAQGELRDLGPLLGLHDLAKDAGHRYVNLMTDVSRLAARHIWQPSLLALWRIQQKIAAADLRLTSVSTARALWKDFDASNLQDQPIFGLHDVIAKTIDRDLENAERVKSSAVDIFARTADLRRHQIELALVAIGLFLTIGTLVLSILTFTNWLEKPSDSRASVEKVSTSRNQAR